MTSRNRLDAVYASLLGMLLIPLDYDLVAAEVSIAALAYPALMLLIVLTIVTGGLAHSVPQLVEQRGKAIG